MNTRPLASLTSSLLARKGQAKPAMRPQGFGGFGRPQDDLGWNDMGFDTPKVAPEPPAVVRQQEELAARVEQVDVAALVDLPKLDAQTGGKKAAFTLRLNEERHLRLRLASAVSRRSSQQLVTQALDELLARIPELDELAARAKAKGK